ncbi:MAG: ornithine--oxo-acid transaminase [Spirochaetales bacterium]|nr:MAG: ornithine--oxo-acid transaminase [Spirochaetales bacterium]
MKLEELLDIENKYCARNYIPANVVIGKGRGVWVWDLDGKRYLDCVSAYGAVNQGHCHPKILKSLVEQAEKLTIISRAFRSDIIGTFCRELCEVTGSRKVLLMNSGAEAVETALKAVRKWGYAARKVPKDKAEIIVCADNFHGRTIAIIGFSSVDLYRKGFGPFTGGFVTIPFGDAEALKKAITPNTVGFLLEPIQAEGGINVPPAGYLKDIRSICTEAGIALMFDEIQTGFGRTGTMLAEDLEHIKADVSIVGKSLGGGFYPISAVCSRNEVLDAIGPGEHGSTFGGNPLACAVARTSLKVIQEENMVENARKMGLVLKKEFENMKSRLIKAVRGTGLMLGLELSEESPDLCAKLIDAGLLVNKAGKGVIRVAPPLVVSEEEAGWALERFREVLCD